MPSSNINRDDSGSPKTAIYGGVVRSRVSSQSWKRAVRQSFYKDAEDQEWLRGHRTKKIAQLLAKKIREKSNDFDDDKALEKALEVLKAVGIKTSKDKDSREMLTGALLFVSNGQLEKIAEYALNNDALEKKSLKKIFCSDQSLDLALFGRMVADNSELNVDAAVQVAHAVSTHEITPEFDYFTALDDDRSADNMGSAMIGTIEYNSSTLYRYANVNMKELTHNLGIDLAVKGLLMFIKDFVMSMPTGKQNTFANKTVPQYVMVTIRTDTPVNLVSAFEEPVKSRNGYVEPSIERLEKEFSNTSRFVDEPKLTEVVTNKVSGIARDNINLEELLKRVDEAIRKEINDGSTNN